MKIPYIIIAVLLAIDNIFINFKINGISYDRLLEFMFFGFFFKSFLLEIKNNPFFKKWNTFLILFTILQLFVNFKLAIVGKIEFEVVYTEFVKCISFIAFSYLFLLIANKDIRYVNVIVFIHFLICIFAFLQHPLSPVAAQMLEIKKMLYVSVQSEPGLANLGNEEAYISGGFAERYRLSGPFVSSINFSYFAISSFAINFYLYLRYKRNYYLAFLIVLFIASIFSQTRSLLLAEIFLVLGYFFFAPIKRHGFYKLAIVTGAFFAIFLVYASKDLLTGGNSRITKISSEGQSDARPLLWATGIYAVMNYPLGITDQDYRTAKLQMFSKYGNPSILHLASHNGLINIGFHYSFIGYILFFYFILFLLDYIKLLDSEYVVLFKLILFSYLIHTSFHNNFILNADYPFLMVLMLINVNFKDKNHQNKNINN
ncbi:hypothetical protein DHD05_22080 [Arenibacter sp. N53]|uniref:O-antigen ligase family protein n=1 Tax=Arenibacter TaxID=178469 RepID=UPI000CD4544E|nr:MULTISPECIES: hypothetical protein [Arenibacter]MCM4154284.1 hypothetical protein [Arenibacter sp. N53]